MNLGGEHSAHYLRYGQAESESAPNPLTHRFPFRHDVGNGGNGGGYEHAITQVHPRAQGARGRAVRVDGGRHLRPDRARARRRRGQRVSMVTCVKISDTEARGTCAPWATPPARAWSSRRTIPWPARVFGSRWWSGAFCGCSRPRRTR